MEKEQIGEPDSKKRKGRPSSINPELLNHIHRVHPEIKTKRGLYQKMYEYIAIRALGFLKEGQVVENHPLKWLCDYTNEGKKGAIKSSILAELGRFEDEQKMYKVALGICQSEPPAQVAVYQIREVRTGRKPSGSVLDLSDELISVINIFLAKYGNATHQTVVDALELVMALVMESKERDENQVVEQSKQ